LGALAVALQAIVLVGCLPSDPGPDEKLVVARGDNGVSLFVVGCNPERLLERDVRVLVVQRSAPIMSSTGSLVLDGSLDESGSLVIAGTEFDEFVAAVQQASASEELRFQGVQEGAVRQNRFEFALPIPTLQGWLADADGEPFLYRNNPVAELPQAAAERRCGLASS